ncbi:MAG: N-acetyl-gamma-glutamyl-phosphate reductase [Sphingomonadales bacterium]|jgi:N-acetyl-gamma-glutamyl-phosphate reductase|nr:N-acetyl-gamma-glutamyl-phosphate reductase [Sphingomonadales bacterium]
MIRTAILGASGYVGAELLRLIAAHPELAPVKLFGESRAGQKLGSIHPHLVAAFPDAVIEKFDGTLDGIDLVFAALPHGHSQRLAASILDQGIPLVDLGADFRLDDAATYGRWYGHAHEAPELLSSFVYGIPELNRAAIKESKAVAAAGCYATAAILALHPLVEAGLVKADSLIVDAASGVSGAGREAKEATGFSTVDGSFAAYGLLNHRHTAEMEMALGGTVLFTPHLVPMTRGILATCYGEATGPCDPLDALRAAYVNESFVNVSDQLPATKPVTGSNGVQITARYDERTGRVLALSALDNLGKGAAGQMIQCANLMLGLDETAGLTTIGVYP